MNILTHLLAKAHTQASLVLDGSGVVERTDVTDWDHDGNTVRSAIRFGPYMTRVQADAIRVEVDGVTETIRFTETLTIPAGVVFVYDLSVTASTV